ncbi:virulence RhuM family protein [Cellulophaga sp. 20_2_10]|uniref:virulence protein RhuM/Fic/DOC family protein n=1 Tax=Cellulophaga sp. 20_2_10 TaxID=2942476 RepID=UPI00201B302E|nr:virulence protein RhuM/Fic/DOC family protein [Cellulophaga sp. 20_2_10]MCL5244479.1 virulence RhuM family protein [Cellulophaga sp. 20_2_10]
MSEIKIFLAKGNQVEVSVQFDNETVWLNRNQLVTLFDRDVKTIGKHINNVFKERELSKDSVVAKFATTALDGKTYQTEHYNLDVIISVGYRVKSQRGTQFRIWANSILKDYLIKGYALNEKRLEQKEQEVKLLKDGIHILTRTVSKAIEDKASDTIILETFAKGLSLLDDYDHEELDAKGLTTKEANYPSLNDYQEIINQMLTEFDSDVFGKEKDKSFESSVAQIAKGFGDDDFYPSLEEKATMLLYFVVKNHSFVDGNKRIAAACFLKFLQQNNMLFNSEQQPIISNDTLASLTLFIASSKPEEMQTVARLVISVLNRNKDN